MGSWGNGVEGRGDGGDEGDGTRGEEVMGWRGGRKKWKWEKKGEKGETSMCSVPLFNGSLRAPQVR